MNAKSKASLSEWWSQPAPRPLEILEIDKDEGLSSDRVDEMREHYGANEMREEERTGLGKSDLSDDAPSIGRGGYFPPPGQDP